MMMETILTTTMTLAYKFDAEKMKHVDKNVWGHVSILRVVYIAANILMYNNIVTSVLVYCGRYCNGETQKCFHI